MSLPRRTPSRGKTEVEEMRTNKCYLLLTYDANHYKKITENKYREELPLEILGVLGGGWTSAEANGSKISGLLVIVIEVE